MDLFASKRDEGVGDVMCLFVGEEFSEVVEGGGVEEEAIGGVGVEFGEGGLVS